MERSHCADVVMVSRHWTPGHLDVTDAPITYARPKPAWIDRLDRRRTPCSNAADRLARRRMSTGAVVDPYEIPVLPPLPSPVKVEPARFERAFATFYGAVARRLPTRRIAV
jgi:hypothetical protein